MKKEKTVVVFRKWRNGDIIALFPKIPIGIYCQSYEHFGQHSSASYLLVVSKTKLAKPKEYTKLKKELEKIGYNLKIRRRTGVKTRRKSEY